MEGIVDNVKEEKKVSFKPKSNGGSINSKIESAFKFMKNHVIWLEEITPLPITSRAFGFASVLSYEAATKSPVAPMDVTPNTSDVWKSIRAAYLALSVTLSYVHENANTQANITRFEPAIKHVQSELTTIPMFTSVRLLCDQVGMIFGESQQGIVNAVPT